MNGKLLTAFLLTAILVTSLVLALNFEPSTPAILSKSVNKTSFTITNTETQPLDFTLTVPTTISDGTNSVTLSFSDTVFLLANGTSKTINITREDIPSNFNLGLFSSNILVNAVNSTNSSITENKTVAVSFRNSFCDKGDVSEAVDNRNLEIISVKDTSSDNDWEWKPLDTVDIDVKVRFNSDDSNDDIDAVIKIALYDTDNNEFIEFENDDETERDVSLDEGDSVTEKFSLEVPVEGIEDGSTRYKLYFKLYEDGNEEGICRDYTGDDYFKDIEINKESRDVSLNEIEFDSPVLCGEEIVLTAKAFNIGSNDEREVYVSLFNKELGIDLESTSFALDEGDSEEVSFSFNIPSDATEKTYILQLKTFYNYKKSSETYEDESDPININLKVEGNCKKTVTENVAITATLESDAIAGNEITVKANVKNTGDAETAYTILTSGTEAFGVLQKIEPQTFTLKAGESKDVLVTLKANSDASGEYTFNINAIFNGQTKEQPVSLTIEGKTSPFGGITGAVIAENFRQNWLIWVIVIVNIILIILIIVIAIRISRS